MRERSGHLANDQLLRCLDEELSVGEASAVEGHLAICEQCKARYREFGAISVRVESVVSSVVAKIDGTEREVLARQMRAREQPQARRFALRAGWSMAIAAGLLLAIVFLPRAHSTKPFEAATMAPVERPQTFQVLGETFVALPYSNTELPIGAPHIVEMQVPVSTLSEAGVIFEPLSLEQANPDRSVLADVLFGADGEPLGVHVIGAD
jgi:anti-sigma factor RsiW